ncbi:hypothetical protein As57867_003095, partial [Aphanomyces stellatus]
MTTTMQAVKWLGMDKDGKITVSPASSLKVLHALPARQPVNLISIFGAARQGKSFLMNLLANQQDLFRISNEKDPCAQGVDLSSHFMPLEAFFSRCRSVASNVSVGFVDAEGQGDRDITYKLIQLHGLVFTAILDDSRLVYPIATYNPMTNISTAYPSLATYLRSAHVPLNDTTRVIVATPAFFDAAEALVQRTSLQDLQTAVAFQYITSMSGALGSDFRNASRVNTYLGELVTRYYLQRAFQESSLDAIQVLTGNIRRAFNERLSRSKWIDETTRTEAVAKLTNMTQLLGYGVLPYVDQLHIGRSYPSTRREYPVEADRMLNLLAVLAKAAQNVELAEGETRKVFGHLH